MLPDGLPKFPEQTEGEQRQVEAGHAKMQQEDPAGEQTRQHRQARALDAAAYLPAPHRDRLPTHQPCDQEDDLGGKLGEASPVHVERRLVRKQPGYHNTGDGSDAAHLAIKNQKHADSAQPAQGLRGPQQRGMRRDLRQPLRSCRKSV